MRIVTAVAALYSPTQIKLGLNQSLFVFWMGQTGPITLLVHVFSRYSPAYLVYKGDFMYVHIYMYVCVCIVICGVSFYVCVCVCVCIDMGIL